MQTEKITQGCSRRSDGPLISPCKKTDAQTALWLAVRLWSCGSRSKPGRENGMPTTGAEPQLKHKTTTWHRAQARRKALHKAARRNGATQRRDNQASQSATDAYPMAPRASEPHHRNRKRYEEQCTLGQIGYRHTCTLHAGTQAHKHTDSEMPSASAHEDGTMHTEARYEGRTFPHAQKVIGKCSPLVSCHTAHSADAHAKRLHNVLCSCAGGDLCKRESRAQRCGA